jgi:hypothetical protein
VGILPESLRGGDAASFEVINAYVPRLVEPTRSMNNDELRHITDTYTLTSPLEVDANRYIGLAISIERGRYVTSIDALPRIV